MRVGGVGWVRWGWLVEWLQNNLYLLEAGGKRPREAPWRPQRPVRAYRFQARPQNPVLYQRRLDLQAALFFLYETPRVVSNRLARLS